MDKRCPLALVHDYLIQMGGAERVVASMVRRYPECPIYTSAVRWDGLLPEFRSARIIQSWMQRLPAIERWFKMYFALYPLAFRSFGEIPADTVWVSASTFAKCIRFSPRTASILYCHNPTRFLWQAGEAYVDSEVRIPFANQVVHRLAPWLRRIDRLAANRYDVVVANSEAVRTRIIKYYERDPIVIHPPVEISRFEATAEHDGSYLVVSRLVAYKCIDRAVLACSQTNRPLILVGEGPDRKRLEGLAGPTVSFRGWQPDSEVQSLMQRCRAFIFCTEEDFGIAPVEVQACGKPVIAFAGGGALETVIEGETGCFFHKPKVEAVLAALERADAIPWDSARIRQNAERFGEAQFLRETARALAMAEAVRFERLARMGANAEPTGEVRTREAR
jgi:glycosyltransferase involved in cell wall biosynthesis